MPGNWSPPPEELPAPQTIKFQVVKLWDEGQEDGASISGTVSVVSGGRPMTEALDAFLDTLTAAGWTLYVAESTQQIVRPYLYEPPAAPETPPGEDEESPVGDDEPPE